MRPRKALRSRSLVLPEAISHVSRRHDDRRQYSWGAFDGAPIAIVRRKATRMFSRRTMFDPDFGEHEAGAFSRLALVRCHSDIANFISVSVPSTNCSGGCRRGPERDGFRPTRQSAERRLRRGASGRGSWCAALGPALISSLAPRASVNVW